jgi:hypothetical protein
MSYLLALNEACAGKKVRRRDKDSRVTMLSSAPGACGVLELK